MEIFSNYFSFPNIHHSVSQRYSLFRSSFWQALLLCSFVFCLGFYVVPAHAASASLVISEVLYDPTGTEPAEEWFELYNLSGSAITLASYKVGDEETSGGGEGMMQFPSGTIAAGNSIVIANQAAAFFSVYGFNPDYELTDTDASVPNMVKYSAWSNGNISMTNTSEEMLILGPGDGIIDAVSWGSSIFAFNPAAPDVAAGHSLARVFANIDTDTAADWLDQLNPDPGQVTVSASPVPLPPAVWLFLSSLGGLVGLARRKPLK